MHTHKQPLLTCMHARTVLSFTCAGILWVLCTWEIRQKTHSHKHTVLCQCCPSQWQSAAGQLRRSNNWALHLPTCQSCFLPVCRCCQTINHISLFYILLLSSSFFPTHTVSIFDLLYPILYCSPSVSHVL